MSGPKHAEVYSPTSDTARVRRLMSDAADRAGRASANWASQLAQCRQNQQEAEAALVDIRRGVNQLSADERRAAGTSAVAQMEQAVRGAEKAQSGGDSALKKADAACKEAQATLETASLQSSDASDGLSRRGASDTQSRCNAATSSIAQATREFGSGQKALADAVNKTAASLSAAQAAQQNLLSLKTQAQTRLRAEEEARRIAEENERRATLGIQSAHAALDRLNGLPHEKFAPGKMTALNGALTNAQRRLSAKEADAATREAASVEKEAGTVYAAVTEAHERWLNAKEVAEASVAQLKAQLNNVGDPSKISGWANDTGAHDGATAALAAAQTHLTAERFDEAGKTAAPAAERLAVAAQEATENEAAHAARNEVGKTIMGVLQELNYDVSFEDGTRDTPFKISGLTPNDNGRGDFDLAIPLNGEVEFHVETPDASCVAAVTALRERLATRGVDWNTTKWGLAEGSVPVQAARTQDKQRQQERERR